MTRIGSKAAHSLPYSNSALTFALFKVRSVQLHYHVLGIWHLGWVDADIR